MFKFTSFVASLALASVLAAPVYAHKFEKNGITIGHPWARATPDGAEVGAGYAKITNTGKEADKIVSGTFENAKALEFHEMKTEGGVMKMRQLTEGVVIKPGETVVFAPSGNHFMFTGLGSTLKAGMTYKGSLTLEKAGQIDIEFKTEAIGALDSQDAAAQPADNSGAKKDAEHNHGDHGNHGGHEGHGH